MERKEMLEKLKGKLSDKRFVHSIGVEYTAACLAMTYKADLQKARIAGLLHDCAKCLTTEEKLKKAEKFGLNSFLYIKNFSKVKNMIKLNDFSFIQKASDYQIFKLLDNKIVFNDF